MAIIFTSIWASISSQVLIAVVDEALSWNECFGRHPYFWYCLDQICIPIQAPGPLWGQEVDSVLRYGPTKISSANPHSLRFFTINFNNIKISVQLPSLLMFAELVWVGSHPKTEFYIVKLQETLRLILRRLTVRAFLFLSIFHFGSLQRIWSASHWHTNITSGVQCLGWHSTSGDMPG